jgi:hypothetical protein
MAINKNFIIKNGLEVSQDVLYVDPSTGKVGIGLTAPSAKLTVSGDAYVTGLGTITTLNSTTATIGQVEISSGVVTGATYYGDGSTLSGLVTSITAGDFINVSASTGNVTITGLANTSNVNADSLVVTGVSTLGVVTGATYYGDGSNLTGSSPDFIAGSGISSDSTYVGTGITLFNFIGGSNIDVDATKSGTTANVTLNTSESIVITQLNVSGATTTNTLNATGNAVFDANIGIGSDSPAQRLDILGSGNQWIRVTGTSGANSTDAWFGVVAGSSGYITVDNDGSGDGYEELIFDVGGSNIAVLKKDVGKNPALLVNTTSHLDDNASLQVSGSTYLNGDVLIDGSNKSLILNASTSKIGVGTTAARATLDVEGGAYINNGTLEVSTSVSPTLYLDAKNDNYPAIMFTGKPNGGVPDTQMGSVGFGGVTDSELEIWSEGTVSLKSTSYSSTDGLFVNNNKVGIGTTNPTAKLHVVGDALVSGIVTATLFVGNVTGTASYATTAGTASYATTAGIATYATTAGVATALLGGNAGVNTTSTPTNLYVSGNAASNIVALGNTDANTTLDFSQGNNFSLTLTNSIVLSNPTGVTTGQSGIIMISQDGIGSRTCAFGSHWDFPSATPPTLSTGANALDCITYFVRSSTSIVANSLIGIGTL